MRLALHQPDQAGNVGTILRLAACLGVPSTSSSLAASLVRPGAEAGRHGLCRDRRGHPPPGWEEFEARLAGRLVLFTTEADAVSPARGALRGGRHPPFRLGKPRRAGGGARAGESAGADPAGCGDPLAEPRGGGGDRASRGAQADAAVGGYESTSRLHYSGEGGKAAKTFARWPRPSRTSAGALMPSCRGQGRSSPSLLFRRSRPIREPKRFEPPASRTIIASSKVMRCLRPPSLKPRSARRGLRSRRASSFMMRSNSRVSSSAAADRPHLRRQRHAGPAASPRRAARSRFCVARRRGARPRPRERHSLRRAPRPRPRRRRDHAAVEADGRFGNAGRFGGRLGVAGARRNGRGRRAWRPRVKRTLRRRRRW